ncbi:hypothetical protein LX36DRAFT_397297 [Colletotrichum falcatum]|nr:hypothetical protein LX36DRAFT_397297 [Colletotrichum falcatum]
MYERDCEVVSAFAAGNPPRSSSWKGFLCGASTPLFLGLSVPRGLSLRPRASNTALVPMVDPGCMDLPALYHPDEGLLKGCVGTYNSVGTGRRAIRDSNPANDREKRAVSRFAGVAGRSRRGCTTARKRIQSNICRLEGLRCCMYAQCTSAAGEAVRFPLPSSQPRAPSGTPSMERS